MTGYEDRFYNDMHELARSTMNLEKKVEETAAAIPEIKDEIRKLNGSITRLTEALARIATRL